MLKLLVDEIFLDEGVSVRQWNETNKNVWNVFRLFQFADFEKQIVSKPLTTIQSKLENYNNFASFLDDIKWATHKCMVVYNGEFLINRCINYAKSFA